MPTQGFIYLRHALGVPPALAARQCIQARDGVGMRSLLRNVMLWSLTLGHFSVDLWVAPCRLWLGFIKSLRKSHEFFASDYTPPQAAGLQ